MIQKIVTIIIVIIAVVGMIFVVQKERNQFCEGGQPGSRDGEGCPHCQLRDQCKKKR